MGKFRFYHVREGYIEFLHKVDNRVQILTAVIYIFFFNITFTIVSISIGLKRGPMAEPDKRYQALLMNQLAYCEKNKELIASRAKKTYEKAVQGNTPFYRKICCDFKRLESACDKYKVKKAAR